MKSWLIQLMIGAAVLVGWTGMARAQANLYELNIHAGGFRSDLGFDELDNDDTDVLLGGRFLLTPGGSWGFGGNFDWVNVDRIPAAGDDTDIDVYFYSGELNYTFPSTGQGKFFVAGGLGGRTLKIEDEDETRLAAPLGGGFKWLSDSRIPRWGIRADVRDHLVFGDEDQGEDDIENNWEFSGGVSLFF